MTDDSLPPCCPPGSWPQLSRSSKDSRNAPKPKGKVFTTKVAEDDMLPIYYVTPADVGSDKPLKGSIMVLQDVYSVPIFLPEDKKGSSFGRIDGICDALAKEGFAVALPSLFRDDPYDLAVATPNRDKGEDWTTQNVFGQSGGPEWFKKYDYAKVKPTLVATAQFLKEKHGDSKPASLGFCFGAWCMTKASAEGDVNFACSVACHPATILESALHGGDEVDLLKKGARYPTLFLVATNDSDAFHEGASGRETLKKSGGGVIEFPDMVHGWVSRGDTGDETVKRDVDKAMSCMVDFFNNNIPT